MLAAGLVGRSAMAISHSVGSARAGAWDRKASRASLLQRVITRHFGRDFLFFVLFGGLAAMTNLAVGALLYGVPAFARLLPYWLAVAVGASAGLFVNFFLNYGFNFRFRGRSAVAQFKTFCVVAGVGIILTSLLSTTLVALFRALGLAGLLAQTPLPVSEGFLAHFTAVGLVTFYSFFAHKFFTFNVGIRRRMRSLLLAIQG